MKQLSRLAFSFVVLLLGCGATDTLDGLRENKTNVGEYPIPPSCSLVPRPRAKMGRSVMQLCPGAAQTLAHTNCITRDFLIKKRTHFTHEYLPCFSE